MMALRWEDIERETASLPKRRESVPVWPAPDMSVLAAGRRPPPTMPREMFGPVWPLIEDFAEGAGAPVDYVALGFLPAAASLIGGKRRVRPYAEADWAEPCILWAGLVGDPSANKSPALDRVTNPLRDLEREHADDHKESLLAWQTDCERARVEKTAWQASVKKAQEEGLSSPPMPAEASEPMSPQRRRLLVQDSTPEALALILSGNPAGTLHLRDELAGWLDSFDRYTPGGRSFWLEAYGGRPYVTDRKGSPEPVTIPFNGVSVVGGIQPEKLADALFGRNAPDDGLVARFLWAWPDRKPYSRPRRAGDPGALAAVYSRLDGLQWGIGQDGKSVPVTLPLDPRAADLFEQFERANRDAGDDAAGMFKSFCGKLPGTLLRLALVSELSRWAFTGGPEPKSISVATIGAVASFVDDYAKPAALRVFGDAALPAVERNAAALARYIVRHGLPGFNARTLRRTSGIPGLKDAAPFNEALSLLIEADWLRESGRRDGDSPGRLSSDYIVNPGVHGAEQ